MRVKVCISDMKIKPPVPVKRDFCLVINDEVPRPGPEHRYFSTKAYWFYMTHERDVESAYLQVAMRAGLVELYYGNMEIKSVREFKSLAKQLMPRKYVVTRDETGWAGLLYKSNAPQVAKNIYCDSLRECAKYEGHLYKRWTKFVPQLLMGWAKKYHGINLIDYTAWVVNSKLRQVCAPHRECVAHVHDGLVMSGGPGPGLPFEHKLEERRGWSWAGLVAPGDPPRYWGFQPNSIADIILIDETLKTARSPEEVMDSIMHLCLFPQIFKASIGRSLSGLVDLEYAIMNLGEGAEIDYKFILSSAV